MKKLIFPLILALSMIFILAAAWADDEEPITYTGVVVAVDGNDIILEDGVVINTSPKRYSNDQGWGFKDEDGNGNNDILEALIGAIITVEGEPEYEVLDPDTGDPVMIIVLVAVDAYKITYDGDETHDGGEIFIREPGKAPWARGPKS